MTQIIGLSAFLPTMVAKLLVKKKKIIDIHTPMLATAQLCNQLHHNTEIMLFLPYIRAICLRNLAKPPAPPAW